MGWLKLLCPCIKLYEKDKFYRSQEPGIRISGKRYDGRQPKRETKHPSWTSSHKAGPAQATVEKQLEQLEHFHKTGALTASEFEDAKKRILTQQKGKTNVRKSLSTRAAGLVRSTSSAGDTPVSETSLSLSLNSTTELLELEEAYKMQIQQMQNERVSSLSSKS